MVDIEIGGRLVGIDHEPYVVAEIGQNHNGDVYTALRMISMAHRCGCDAVKFQLRNAEEEICRQQLDAAHPNPAAAFGPTYREHRKKLDLNAKDLRHIAARIQYNEWPIQWFATPCWIGAIEQLEELNVPAYKIASKDLTNIPLIEEAASTQKPIILSTGMAVATDIDRALSAVADYHSDVIVMQCTSEYPCANENVHLAAMVGIREEFGCLVGFSDHTIGILASPLAVALGAVMVEKHITLCRAMPGTDQAAAVEEDGLKRLVRDVKTVPAMIGDYAKRMCPAAEPARIKLAGSLVCKRPLRAGDWITEEDLTLKAPGDGLAWHQREYVVGRQAARDIGVDEQVRTSDVI